MSIATTTQPTNTDLERIVSDTLVPLLSGSTLQRSERAPLRNRPAVQKQGKDRLLVKPSSGDDTWFVLTRSQNFARTEVTLADVFVELLQEILPNFGRRYFPDLLLTSVRRIIARTLGYENEQLLLNILDTFEALSAQTYEGHRISASIGLDERTLSEGISIQSIWNEDFSKVLTSGVDTMLTVSPNGNIFDFRDFETSANLPFAPFHARLIADWATGKRIGIILNRNGEILIFQQKKLAFARRRGRWHHFVHEPVINQMGRFSAKILTQCVYETCLDVSFARTGGCICIVKSENLSSVKDLINPADRIGTGTSPKSQVIDRLLTAHTTGQTFQALSRRFRQALAAIDGALVLSHKGEILAAGAIVRVPGGSESGARRAAAKALSRLGVGIKISADGGIVGFVHEEGAEKPRTVFEFT